MDCSSQLWFQWIMWDTQHLLSIQKKIPVDNVGNGAPLFIHISIHYPLIVNPKNIFLQSKKIHVWSLPIQKICLIMWFMDVLLSLDNWMNFIAYSPIILSDPRLKIYILWLHFVCLNCYSLISKLYMYYYVTLYVLCYCFICRVYLYNRILVVYVNYQYQELIHWLYSNLMMMGQNLVY